MSHSIAQPVKTVKYFTPGVIIICIIALNGIAFILLRFIYGIGVMSNLDNSFPWGIWNAINKGGGVALAAGGFISAAIGHILHREHYHDIVRPALLTAMLGYTFVGGAVFIDIGRWYYIWHPVVMWNPNSALFEVGICVMIYLTVLYIEFLPVVTERFAGKVNLPGFLGIFNNFLNKLLFKLDGALSNTLFVFIIAGVVLSSLHQSSLGTLMIIAGTKIHPLWQTPILPLLFLMSAVGVGVPMIIFESMLASRSFKMKPKMPILSRLASYVAPILGVYLSFKLGDMMIRKSFVYLTVLNAQSVLFLIEILGGVVLPLILFLNKKVLKSPALLFTASCLVIFGVLMNRINYFLTAYHPPYANYSYFPSFGEISVSLGFAAILVLLYRAAVMIFPVIVPDNAEPEHSQN